MALMQEFQTIDAVPDQFARNNQDAFVFQPANRLNNDQQTSQQFLPAPQFQSQTPLTSQNPSQISSLAPSPLARFPSRETSRNIFSSQPQDNPSLFSSQERESLIGHLAGLDPKSLVLTPRQRQALEEETRLRQSARPTASTSQAREPPASFLSNQQQQTLGQQFNLNTGLQTDNFRNFQNSQSDAVRSSNPSFKRPSIRFLEDERKENGFPEPVLPELVLDGSKRSNLQIQPTQQLTTNQQRLPSDADRVVKSMREPLLLREQVRSQQQNNFLPRPQPNLVNQDISNNHPSVFLNQLSPQKQQLFLDQFLSLSPDHQAYVYQKFLSTPPETQQFAIQQFLSLDQRVLVVSIQAELDKENALRNKPRQENALRKKPRQEKIIPFERPTFKNPEANDPLRNLQRFAQKTTDIASLNPDNLSIEELRSLQEQRQLEEQQQQLQAIIETQKSLNRRG